VRATFAHEALAELAELLEAPVTRAGDAALVDGDTIVLGDIGSHNQWTRLLPAAMTAKLAFPRKQVIAVTGDGCFLMASADFATAVECGLNPVVVILNDRQYGMIVGMQEATYGRARDGAGRPGRRAAGADGVRVDKPEQLRAALERGLASPTIFVIDGTCDYRFPPYDLARAASELG
jgi:thiamine pyrophosphate-dependent acetolactate synthase large subunit-like protein